LCNPALPDAPALLEPALPPWPGCPEAHIELDALTAPPPPWYQQ